MQAKDSGSGFPISLIGTTSHAQALEVNFQIGEGARPGRQIVFVVDEGGCGPATPAAWWLWAAALSGRVVCFCEEDGPDLVAFLCG